jgi:cobalt-zinc-cadmium efflux system protein
MSDRTTADRRDADGVGDDSHDPGHDHAHALAHGHGGRGQDSRGDHDQNGHDHSGHSHGDVSGSSSRRLAIVAGLNLLGFVAELAGGLLFGSVALVSDAVHMLFDALAYVLAFAAAFVAARTEPTDRWSFGFHRLEPLAAFLNGALLIPMVAFILYESYQRFVDPVAIGTGPVLAIAVGGLAINGLSVLVLEGNGMSLNERGAYYHLLGDAGGSIAVIVAVLAVEYTGVTAIDPIAAALIAGVILWSAGKVLRGSGAIFLHRSPIDGSDLRAALLEIDGVRGVEDLHVWQVCSELTVATVHVRTDADSLSEEDRVTRRVHDLLGTFGVDHATVEPRSTPDGDGGDAIHLDAHCH